MYRSMVVQPRSARLSFRVPVVLLVLHGSLAAALVAQQDTTRARRDR